VGGSVRAGAANDGMFRQQGFFSMGQGAYSLTASAAGDSNRNLGRPLDVMGHPGQSLAMDDAAHGSQFFLRPEAALAGGGKVWLAFGHGTEGHVDQVGYAATGAPAAQLANLATIREIVQVGWTQPWSPTLASDLRYNEKTCRQELGSITPLSGTIQDQAENDSLLFDQIRQVSLQTNWDPSNLVHLVTGFDGSTIETGQSTLIGLPQDETYHATGGFLSLDWQVGAVALSGGARAANESLGGSSVSPRLSAVWILDQSSVLRAGYFTSTRSPTAVEKNASLSTVGLLPYDLVRNPGLQSEKAEDYEIGYRKQWDRVTLDLTGFRMELKRIIVLRPDNRAGQQKATVSYQNGSGTHTDSGFEIALSAELAPDLQAGWNASTSRLKDPIYGLDQQADYCPKGQTGAWLRCRRGIWFGSFAVQEMGSYTVVVPDGTDRQTISATTHAQFNTGLEPLRGLSLSVYGFNALKGTQEVSNLGLLNLNAKRYTRREMGVQAKYSF
jgi:hypothetical protein